MINVLKRKLEPEGTEYQQLLYILQFLIVTELNIHQYFKGYLESDVEENKPFGMALYSSLGRWGKVHSLAKVWGGYGGDVFIVSQKLSIYRCCNC